MYKDLINKKNECEGLQFLSKIQDSTIDCCFFDPQYEGIMKKLNFGNKRMTKMASRMEFKQMSDSTIIDFLNEINRVLKHSAYLFFWVDMYHLTNDIKEWSVKSKFDIVDLLTWHKRTFGMGYRLRRTTEFCVVLQKPPRKAKATWSRHDIADFHSQKVDNSKHCHTKPLELLKKLIDATTQENDLILDPCSGSFSVFEACKQLKRNFIGCDIKIKKEIMNDLVDFMQNS